MKIKHLFTIALLGILAFSCQQPPTGYTVRGTISGLPDGARIQLIPVSHKPQPALADTVVAGGKFEFNGTIDEPRAVLLKVDGAYGYTYLMLEKANIAIDGQVTATENNGDISYDFSAVTITGSPLTDRYRQLLSVRSSMDSLHTDYTTRYADVIAAMGAARADDDRARIDSIEASQPYTQLMEAERNFFTTVEERYNRIFTDNGDSYWGPLMMISLMSYFGDAQKPIYESFSQAAKDSYYGKMVFDELYPAGSLGTQVPDFTVTATDGTATPFGNLRQGKKYILIDFWASWCNPCLKEIPHLKTLYQRYADKGFEIVSISIDEKQDDWKAKSDEVQLPWPSFLDRTGEIATSYNVSAIPAMYLVDDKGILVGENLRGEALDNKLAELFAE